MDTTKATTHVSLCAGYGGIDLGLSRAIPDLRTIAFSEIEAFACANLVTKMEAGLLDCAPIWTDLKTFPYEQFYGRVDILSGGYPCQPFSACGKRAGADDPRHLWPFIADGIRLMRPKMCFFENVEGHITLGLSSVISDLEELGYKVSWGVFSAAECGAPHQRKRVFILAHCQQQGLEGFSGDGNLINQQGWIGQESDRSTSKSSISPSWQVVSWAADCNEDDECSVCGFEYAEECECPGPTQDGIEYEEFDGVLYGRSEQFWPSRPSQPQFPGEPARVNQAKSTLGGDVDGTASGMDASDLYKTCDNRTDELRLLGNGVVPATAERAFRTLLTELLND